MHSLQGAKHGSEVSEGQRERCANCEKQHGRLRRYETKKINEAGGGERGKGGGNRARRFFRLGTYS